MATEPALRIDIASVFTGKKAFKQADTATATLAKGAKKLGVALGLAFSTRAIVNYVKQASLAAAADQKAQAILAVNLRNLGLAYASLDSETFINNLEKQTNIFDSELRPAYAKLASATGSIAKTQLLMQVAFDASAKAGITYSSTVEILAQAYVGNTKGLKQLQLGLSQAEIKAMSFDQILQVIQKRTAGAGQQSLKGYAAQMAAFNLATSNAAETLGGAFLDSFVKLVGEGDITKATGEIDSWTKALADTIRVMTGVIKISDVFRNVDFGGFLGIVPTRRPIGPGQQSPGQRAAAVAAEKSAAKKLAAAKKAAAAILAAQKKADKAKEAAEKNNLALSKAAAQFDLTKISLHAALLQTADEQTRLRLEALKAIENDKGELALQHLAKLKLVEDTNQAARLAGNNFVSAAVLLSLQERLLAELKTINQSERAEDDKNQRRDAAFKAYNDAVTKAGGLNIEGYANERVEINNTAIAKAAALQGHGAALATLKAIQNKDIAEIASTQELADKSRMGALLDYIKELGNARTAALALAAATSAASVVASVIMPPQNPGGFAVGQEPGIGLPFNFPTIPMPPQNPGGFAVGQDITINVNAGVIGGAQTIVDAVQAALQEMDRQGMSNAYAGAIDL